MVMLIKRVLKSVKNDMLKNDMLIKRVLKSVKNDMLIKRVC